MLRWTTAMIGSKNIVLANPEDIEPDKFEAIFEEIQNNWADNYQEISRTMMSGLVEFYEGYQNGNSNLVLEYKCYSRILRWIITSGNHKYDSQRFYLWRNALKKLWRYLFGECFHEFRIYLGNNQYRNDSRVWREWFRCIGGDFAQP